MNIRHTSFDVSSDAINTTLQVHAVIPAGGSGTRLWPLSRKEFPKQLIGLVGDDSLLQLTAKRLQGLASSHPLAHTSVVICGEEHRFMIAEQLRKADIRARVVLEPDARNTAPALTLAALSLADEHDDAIMVVMPADHAITDTAAFQQSVSTAIRYAAENRIVALGIVPTRAETGYGYIKTGAELDTQGSRRLDGFVEKPARDVAEGYVASGQYLWNSGLFVVRASIWLRAIEKYEPAIYTACVNAFEEQTKDADFQRIDAARFDACPSQSIDYAVMERVVHPDSGFATAVVPLEAGWSDVGSWDAVWDVMPKDDAGNVAHGRVMLEGSTNTYAHSDSRLVACVGTEDLVVVETPDAVLVAHKSAVQDVKAVVARIRREAGTEATYHRKVYRPWGYYDSIDSDTNFQVKRIVVKPGGVLSLQMHHHRAEHWIVVKGTARVTRGTETFLLSENQSTYIPLGEVHRLENPGKTPLAMIEVQSGSYLGEDDIVRFEDTYGRS